MGAAESGKWCGVYVGNSLFPHACQEGSDVTNVCNFSTDDEFRLHVESKFCNGFRMDRASSATVSHPPPSLHEAAMKLHTFQIRWTRVRFTVDASTLLIFFPRMSPLPF